MNIERMDPDYRAPTLAPMWVCAALTLATAFLYWFTGVFDQLGSLYQFATR